MITSEEIKGNETDEETKQTRIKYYYPKIIH
jgi:hypothetical protein